MRNSLPVLVALLLAAPSALAAQTAFGPLSGQEAGPLQRVGFSHTVERAELLAPGTVQVENGIAYSNIFEQDSAATHVLFLDLERISTDLGVRWGITERLEAAARFAFETTGGGILDGFISGWHRTIGLPNANRGKYPLGVYAQRLTDGDGEVRLNLPARTMALEDVRVSLKWAAWRSPDGRRLVTLGAVARVPIQDNLVGPRRADVALMALGRASWTRWHLHGSLGGATVRAARDFDGLLRPAAFFADVALERNLASWLSAVAQLSLETPRLQGFGDPELDGWPVNLVLGATGALAEGWSLDVSLQEDVPTATPAVDFTLGIGVRRSW
jgi:hypothetical protein